MPGRAFVGRAGELAAVQDELARVRRAQSRMVLVVGGAGMGKTRLLAELERRHRRQTMWLVGRGSPLATALPFAPLVEAVESYLSRDASLRGELAGRYPALGVHVPSLATKTDVSTASPLLVFGAFGSLLREIAARGGAGRPVVVVVDDVHQADRSTWDLLGYLARNPLPAPVLFVVACRTEALATDPDLAGWVGALVKDRLAEELSLRPLGTVDLAELAAQTVGPEKATAEVVSWLADRSRGNALFATALLDDFAADPHRREVPGSVRDRVQLVLSGLPRDARALLEAAAVLGQRFDQHGIVALVPDAAPEWLDDLTRRGLLVEPSPGSDGYDFAHPLVQEAVYEGMGAVRRRSLHRRAVQVIRDQPAAVRAYHAARGASPGDRAAVDVIVAAAREAEQGQVHRQAVALLQSALSVLGGASEDRKQLLDELGWQAGCVGDHLVGLPALRELLSLVADDPAASASVLMRLASLLAWGDGDLTGAESAAREAIGLFTSAELDERAGVAVNELAWIIGARGDVEEQIAGARSALALADEHGHEEARLHALGTLGHGLALAGRVEEALTTLDEGRALAERRADGAQAEWFTAVLIEAYVGFGRLKEAEHELRRYDATGAAPIDLLPSRRALLEWCLGRWTAAAEACGDARSLFPIAQPIHSAWSLSLNAVLAQAAGHTAEAMSSGAQADRIYRGRRIYWMSARHEWLCGLAAWGTGNLDEATRRLSGAADWARRMGAVVVEGQILPDLVEVLTVHGDRTSVASYADRFLDLAERFDSPLWAGQSHYVQALIAADRGQPARARQASANAAAALQQAGAPFLAARAFEHLAICCDGAETVEALTSAARLYHQLPAPMHEQRVRDALRTHGRRGQQSARTVGSLTRRERDVLDLAVSALSTREIAERLHIGERTVETHLANLYRKLGVRGRHELPNPRAGTGAD